MKVNTSTQKTGISDIIPCSNINACLFDPCGYSMNALLPEVCVIYPSIGVIGPFSYIPCVESRGEKQNDTSFGSSFGRLWIDLSF